LEFAMPGSSLWMTYAPQGVKGLDDDDDNTFSIRNANFKLFTFFVHVTWGLQFTVYCLIDDIHI
jgi:hypothetical protein